MEMLLNQLTQCHEDTRAVIGVGAANRLAAFRQCQSVEEVVNFISRIIANRNNQANGFMLATHGRTSLESIIRDNQDLFENNTILKARETLGQYW